MPGLEGRTRPRTRRPPERAQEEILDAAERHLVADGPYAVRVQVIAREIGITDAAVHYHFGSREGLLQALLRRAGRRLRDEVVEVIERWDPESLDIGELGELLRRLYSERGYARLTAWLRLAGWSPSGAGMLRPQAEELHRLRADAGADDQAQPDLDDTLFSLVLLNMVLWSEPLIGEAALKMFGLVGDELTARRFRRWLTQLVGEHLSVP